MSVAEQIALLAAIGTCLGVAVAFVVALLGFIKWRDQRRQRELAAERKLRDACDLLKSARDAQLDWLTSSEAEFSKEPGTGQEDEAQCYLLDALELGPSRKLQAAIRLELGALAHRRGELDSAEEELTESIRLNRRYAKAYEERGLLRWYRRDHSCAFQDMERALDLLPRTEREEIERRLHSWRAQITET